MISSKVSFCSVFEGNDNVIDPKGSVISLPVRQLLDYEILKERMSLFLSYEVVYNTVVSMMSWGNRSENAVNGFIALQTYPAQLSDKVSAYESIASDP